MANGEKASGPTVCLYAAHPLALVELEQSLADHGFRVQARRPELDGSFAGPERLPRASAYVLDLPSQRAVGTVVSRILDLHPGARILVVGDKFDDPTAFSLLRSGVKGFIRYADTRQSLGRAVEALLGDGYWAARSLLSRFIEHSLGGASRPRGAQGGIALSGREREVLDLILENLSNKEIASRLHISPRTAKFHVSNLLVKHGVRKRAELIVLRFALAPHA